MWVRFGILVLFGGYFTYAWGQGWLRGQMGIAAPGDYRLDYLQKASPPTPCLLNAPRMESRASLIPPHPLQFLAAFMMIFALFIFITGKRI